MHASSEPELPRLTDVWKRMSYLALSVFQSNANSTSLPFCVSFKVYFFPAQSVSSASKAARQVDGHTPLDAVQAVPPEPNKNKVSVVSQVESAPVAAALAPARSARNTLTRSMFIVCDYA